MVQLQTSEIAEDLAWYLSSSEQVPSSIGLGVELDRGGQVAVAGGFLVQSLPPGNEEQVEMMIERLQKLPPTTSMLRQGLTPAQILIRLFDSVEFRIQERVPVTFYCPCSRPQIERMLIGFGKQELRRLAEDSDPVEVVCEYCRQLYCFDSAQLETLIGQAG